MHHRLRVRGSRAGGLPLGFSRKLRPYLLLVLNATCSIDQKWRGRDVEQQLVSVLNEPTQSVLHIVAVVLDDCALQCRKMTLL